ncbi:MAG: hypothetical protein ACJ75S_07095 [Solirubrobacterales bacterium]|jgi:hypothetical protein
MSTELLLASRCCDQCLVTPERIVSGEKAAQIVRNCKAEDNHFFCHKGTLAGKPVHCRGVHDRLGGSRAYRFALAYNIPIVEIDPEAL